MKTKGLFIYNRTIKFACVLVSLLYAVSVSSQNEIGRLRTDSLRDILQKTNTHEEKLAVLKERDSLLYWNAMIDTISRRRAECPDALFASGSLVFQEYLWAGEYEMAMNEAVRQIRLADKERQEYGQARGNYNLALIYQATGQDSSAVEAFRKGLVWVDKNLNDPGLELQYLSDMIISTLRLDLFDESEQLLFRYGKLLDKLEQDYETKGYSFPILSHRCLICSYFSELYTRKEELGKAREYLEQASALVSDSLAGYVKYVYYKSSALYYMKTSNDKKALEAIDKALEQEKGLDLMTLKMQVLRHSGQLKEAIRIYKEILAMNTAINNEAFERQIKQLRILNDVSDSEKQERELMYQNEQIASRQHQLVHVLATIFILLILFFVLYRLYCRTRRLQNELSCEKDSLVESEKQLRIIKEKAVEANRLKTVFISSISHEVRTPLNAIVGFSELLIDNSYSEEEKVAFASMINHNSELLMNLINDVLDLSRLESGNYSFTIKEWDAAVLCHEITDSLENKAMPGVRLTCTPPLENFPLNTDRFRMHQLLGHLLSNALKFTRKGEVNLTFEVDREKAVVRFIVTDTGCGIPVEMHEKIFERFEKLDEFKQGTGLGLTICQMIAAQFGGTLYLDSSYTEGARFVFVHPSGLETGKD